MSLSTLAHRFIKRVTAQQGRYIILPDMMITFVVVLDVCYNDSSVSTLDKYLHKHGCYLSRKDNNIPISQIWEH